MLIELSHNNLTGSFPEAWNDGIYYFSNLNAKSSRRSRYFRSLKYIRACCNKFTGILRDFVNPFLNVEHLMQMDLSNNRIQGSFQFWAEEWFHYYPDETLSQPGLLTLFYLDLSSNQIGGSLPIALPLTLSIFLILDNKLVGQIPQVYSKLFIFVSKGNDLRAPKLPSFFSITSSWSPVEPEYDGTGVEMHAICHNR